MTDKTVNINEKSTKPESTDNPLADFMAEVEKLGGVEEAMRQLNELNRRLDSMPPEHRLGIRQVETPVLGKPLPPEEVRELLVSSPGRGLFELERLPAVPELYGRIGRIVTDAIGDKRVAPETRARLLWRYNHVDYYRDAALAGAKGTLPFGLLDCEAGRKDYCARRRSGYETIRCSNRVFFKRIQTISSYDWEKGRVKTQEVLKKAIDDDSPAELMVALGVVGKEVDVRLLTWLLSLGKTKILDWLMENDEVAKEWIDPRRVLFYKCANHWEKTIGEAIEQIERTSPGTAASCTDALGRNLLWYTLYNRFFSNERSRKNPLSPVEELLISHGVDPDAKTAWDVSWRQMKCAMAEELREFTFFVNGAPAFDDKGWRIRPPQPEGDAHHFRIVHQGTGLAMAWTFPKRRFPVVTSASLCTLRDAKDNKGFGAVIDFLERDGGKDLNHSVFFSRGPDRLFHFLKSNVIVRKAW